MQIQRQKLKHSNEIRSIRMQNRSIRTRFDQSLAKLNHSKEILTIRMQIRTIRTRFKAIECKFEAFERDSNHSKAKVKRSKDIRSKRMHIQTTIRMQLQNIRARFEAIK